MINTPDKELQEAARQRLEKIVPGKSGSAEALSALGMAELELGQPQAAVGHLEQALAQAPENLQTAVILASIKLAGQDKQGAEALLTNLARQQPKSAAVPLVLGRFYWIEQRREEAKNQFRHALEIDPNNGPALWELARAELADGKADVADQLYKRLSALPDKQYRPMHAMFLMHQGKTSAAIQELENLAASDPKDLGVRRVLTGVYVDVGRPQQAVDRLTAALKANPKDTDALFRRSVAYLLLGRTGEATNDIMQVLHFNGASADAHFQFARVLQAQGNRKQEIQELDKAVSLSPDFLEARIALARALMSQKSVSAALDLMDKTPAFQRDGVPAVTQRNWALIAQGSPEARKEVDRALRLAQSPELLRQDALLKFRQKDYAGGRVSLKAALEKDPFYVEAVSDLYDSYVAEGQAGQALSVLRSYAAQQAGSAPLQYLLALKLKQNGKADEAREVLLALQKTDPRFPLANLWLAEMDMDQNRLDAARQRLSTVLNADPANVAALILLGNIDDLSGRRDAAIADYRKVVQADRTNVMGLNNLAFLLADSNQPAEAVRYAQQAMELSPDNPEVEDTLGWAYFQSRMYDRRSNTWNTLQPRVARRGGSTTWRWPALRPATGHGLR